MRQRVWRLGVTFLIGVTALVGAAGLSLGRSASASTPAQTADAASWLDTWRPATQHIVDRALADDFAWQRLAELTDTFGPRLSGSPNLQLAVDWAAATMKADGFDTVRVEPTTVPRWVRGRERLEMLEPAPRALPMLGLGGSVATPPAGLEGEVLVVDSFDTLERRARDARGRIVVFDVPYTNYGETVRYRVSGASRAARVGAIAMLLRSVGPVGLRTPHTGALGYAEGVARIPAAAIPAEDASMLSRLQARGRRVRLRLSMEAADQGEAPSANVVGELRGRELPSELVVVGGHLDSWDVGAGASDDGAGCIIAWEALRLMKQTGLRPRRTVRLVLFTNEENGLRGGTAYLDRHRAELAQHVMMVEADMGAFAPFTVGFSGPSLARARMEHIASLLRPLGIDRLGPAGGGADIGPAAEAGSVPSLSIAGDAGRYFTVHHTPADTVDRIEPRELARAAAIVAVMTYIVAEMPERLGEQVGTSSR
jgi:carboxypeptidase Q